ncbi:MAG: c-type cytochrome [Thiomicrorhabdus sp.]|nr:c-type cytochrome [Thiomicrorhabdus sp.]
MKRSVKILYFLFLLALSVVLFWSLSNSPQENTHDNRHHLPESLFTSHPELITPIPETLNLNTQKVHLGEQLFHDKNLSHDNTLSCASCHNLQKGGGDGLAQPTTASLQKKGLPNHTVFNSPTIFNVGFNFVQGWEGKTKNLEQQAAIPLFNPFEMGNKNWSNILNYLNQTPHYKQQFQNIYASKISSEQVIDVISEFNRSLTTPNSPFDLYLKGQLDSLTHYELEGYQLFKNRGCISCHNGVNIGGNLFQKAGIFTPMHPQNEFSPQIFKVPTLRNIALTAPYFHNGSVSSLEEAITLMAKHQLQLELPADENKKILAFLHTLTGQYQNQSLSHE